MKKIMTVLGPIPPEELGPTLPHEHALHPHTHKLQARTGLPA